MYCTNTIDKNDICQDDYIDVCHHDIYVIWYTGVQIICKYVAEETFCVVYLFTVAKSTHVDNGSHVYAYYFLHM